MKMEYLYNISSKYTACFILRTYLINNNSVIGWGVRERYAFSHIFFLILNTNT